ncbi:hypothetical protein DEFR109230_03610 [Deinococcus frigens]
MTSGVDNSDATDVDVVAVNFTPTDAEERVIVDCKDRERPKPYERILWVSGLKKYASANRAVFSAPRIPLHAREFAMRGGVEILDSPTIDERIESKKYIDYGYGAASHSLTVELERKWSSVRSQNRELKSSYTDMLSTVIHGNPVTNLNRIISYAISVYNIKPSNSDIAWLKRHICLEGASLFALMLARIASETRILRSTDREDNIRKKLTYGEINPNVIERIFRIAGLGDDPIAAPDYSTNIIEIINEYTGSSTMNLVPFNTDLYIFGHCLLKTGGISEDPAYQIAFPAIEKDAKSIISAYCYATKIPLDYILRRES